MFERFSDRARRVLVYAQEEARLLNHNFIGTEHVLLGLIREGDGVAAKALASLDINLDVVREKVEETIGPAGTSLTGSPPFTPRAKKVLELSLREALQLGHNYIGTEHVLLGLVREGEGVAAQVLVSLGADLDRVRQRVLQVLLVSPVQGEVHEARAEPGPPAAPRCGRCGAALSESARYRSIEARPGDLGAEQDQGPLTVTVLYCGRCGTVLGPYLEGATVLRGPLATTVHLRPAPSSGGGAKQPRRFPDDLLAPVPLQDVPETARVELFYRANEVIEGAVAGTQVRLVGRVGNRRGPLKGTWGEAAVGANWRVGGKLRTPAGRSQGTITGRFGDDAVKLRGYFRLGPRYLAEQADIDGELCGNSLRATVSAADGGLGSTSAVVAEGTLGEEPFELFSALSDDLTKAVVRGSLGGRTVALDATRQEPAEVRIVGEYAGPLPLLAVIVGVVVHFL
jgi:hypothetical protein